MTISTTDSRISYNGNGVTTVFSFPYRFLANGDLVVVSVSSAGVETTKTLTTDYTVTGAGNDAGGSVTMLVAPVSGTRLIIYRNTAITQETDYISGDPFPAETHERALDRLTMIAQEIAPNLARAITLPVGDASGLNEPLPAAANRLDKFIVFDATTGATELSTVTQTQVASAVAAAYAAGSTADAVTFLQAGTGAVSRSVQNRLREVATPRDFGAVGDNSTDDYAAFQAAFTYCQSNQTRLHIGEGSYVLSAQLVATGTFDITCAKTAALRWTSTTDAGILFNFTTADDTLCSIELPQLFSAGINSSFAIPGYVAGAYTYTLANRYVTGVELRGGNRINLSVHYLAGWSNGVLVKASGVSVDNVNVTVNTIDFCVNGIKADAGSSASYGINALVFHANTVWAKYPVYLDGTTGFITSSRFIIEGATFTNETDGSIFYAAGTEIDTCEVDVQWAFAGYAADSTSGVSTSLICPFIAGNQTSNGLTTDGNATLGYFGGTFCEFTIGAVMGVPGGKGASAVPVAGDTIRIRDAGAYNTIRIANSDNVATTAISTTTTAGEANYNGGVGGAQYAKKVYCSASVAALTPLNGTVDHYVYHQCLSPASRRPILVYPADSTLSAQGLMMYAKDDADNQNRRIKIQFVNPSGTRTTSLSNVNFWLEI